MPSAPLPTIRLIVTTNAEEYRLIDVTGAPDGPWLRYQILRKLGIPSDQHAFLSIYPSEAGRYALGGALSDRRLFALCRENGTAAGDLKLFVSNTPDRPYIIQQHH